MRRTNHPFVESSENRLGIGKLVGLNGEAAIVDYFRSPADNEPIREILPVSSLTRLLLPLETRVYYRNPETFTTEVGRVLDYQENDHLYLVRFPNEQSRMIASDDLHVRCRLPIAEPTDHLAHQLNETAFWHEGRSEFVQHLLAQHSVSRGLTALLSSSVELVAHQISVIHRVLLDPFQRYLLADEVGLGKTIEAGVLIKQFVLDEPSAHDTLVIVPDALLVQWQQELTHRFHLGKLLGTSIHIVRSRDISSIETYISAARMIVIDEAHHLSSWAWSSDPSEQRIFATVRRGTENLDRRVLLLSATPVLHNEQSFLAMLNLLDPQVYPLDSVALFKQRVRLRQEIAECMLSLQETEPNFFLAETLKELGTLLADDAEFQTLRTNLALLIENDVDEENAERIGLIRSIRTHVSDMWRLHRRILRNRRTERTAVYMPGRAGLTRVTYRCECEQELAEAVDSWRINLSAACFSANESMKRSAQLLARTMEELAVCEPRKAVDFALRRLNVSFGAGDADCHGDLPLVDDERELLQKIVRTAKDCDQEAKLQSLLRLIGTDNSSDSFVIFANFAETADRIFAYLDLRLPPGRTLRHSPRELGWTQFKSSQRGYVLVCDSSAEEGLNFQKRGASALHFDLPFSPNRVEQRMGRLDRFGVGMPVQSAALICRDSRVQMKWCDLLENALGVFNRSIATLQYVVTDSMQQVWSEYLDSGSDSFAQASARLAGNEGIVAKEVKRIRAQDEIDSFDADQVSQQIADELESQDFGLSRKSAKVFSNWAIHRLQFRRSGEERRGDDVFAYEFTRRVDTGRRPYGHDTLMSEHEFRLRFKDSIDNQPVQTPTRYMTVPLTFDRVVSQQRSTRLLRVGDPFVDALEQFTRWDDRGISYAFWRCVPDYEPIEDPDVFFRFDYVVSPDPEPLIELCRQTAGANSNSLLRRTRSIMVPRFVTIWLDSNLERIEASDSRFVLLRTPFSKQAQVRARDANLNRDRWNAASSIYDMSLWRDRCFAARRRSEAILREQTKLPVWAAQCVAKAKSQVGQVVQQYRSRLAMADGNLLRSLETDLAFEKAFLDAQIQSFTNPELRADSVGAVFLSRQMPFSERSGDEEDEL